jgi:hypothetical protein
MCNVALVQQSVRCWLQARYTGSEERLLLLQNDEGLEYLNKTVREGRGRFLAMKDLELFNIVKNS